MGAWPEMKYKHTVLRTLVEVKVPDRTIACFWSGSLFSKRCTIMVHKEAYLRGSTPVTSLLGPFVSERVHDVISAAGCLV